MADVVFIVFVSLDVEAVFVCVSIVAVVVVVAAAAAGVAGAVVVVVVVVAVFLFLLFMLFLMLARRWWQSKTTIQQYSKTARPPS